MLLSRPQDWIQLSVDRRNCLLQIVDLLYFAFKLICLALGCIALFSCCFASFFYTPMTISSMSLWIRLLILCFSLINTVCSL